MKKIVSILGSTGSIGKTSLKIIEKKKNLFSINILSANKNLKLIKTQIKKFNPKYFIINDYYTYKKLKNLNYKKCKILNNFDLKLNKKNDITISAIPGIEGLNPTINFIKMSKKMLIANKESIVSGWDILKKVAKKNSTKIIPIDSEHFSLSRILLKHKIEKVKKFYITASGGPFLNHNLKDLKKITPLEALKHPKWKMGKKISIDSATLMNKILELVEARKLFNIPSKKLDIVIHPNSLVHAIVELKNGLTEFIYHDNSMIIPIANALFNENILIDQLYKKKNNFIGKKLHFEKVDTKKFPLAKLKYLIDEYPSSAIIINSSNELAVNQFLNGKIPFLGIAKIIMSVLKDRNFKKNAIKRCSKINQVKKIDNWSKKITRLKIRKYYD